MTTWSKLPTVSDLADSQRHQGRTIRFEQAEIKRLHPKPGEVVRVSNLAGRALCGVVLDVVRFMSDEPWAPLVCLANTELVDEAEFFAELEPLPVQPFLCYPGTISRSGLFHRNHGSINLVEFEVPSFILRMEADASYFHPTTHDTVSRIGLAEFEETVDYVLYDDHSVELAISAILA